MTTLDFCEMQDFLIYTGWSIHECYFPPTYEAWSTYLVYNLVLAFVLADAVRRADEIREFGYGPGQELV